MAKKCGAGCCGGLAAPGDLLCPTCRLISDAAKIRNQGADVLIQNEKDKKDAPVRMAELYPKYYKAIPEGVEDTDTYLINMLFPVDDPTGCILHARKKLLVPGTRTGGKTMLDDIREARDTLTRYLELMQVVQRQPVAQPKTFEAAPLLPTQE